MSLSNLADVLMGTAVLVLCSSLAAFMAVLTYRIAMGA